MAKAREARARAAADAVRSADSLFAGAPERFVEGGGLARVMRRVAEPRRSVVVPDPAHDFHGVWGLPLPRDLAAMVRAIAAVDIEWIATWRPAMSDAFVLPGRAKDNLLERILLADQRDRRGTATVELLAGAAAIGDLRGGTRLLYGLHDAPALGAAPIWGWQLPGRVFTGPIAGSLSTLAWSAGVAAARREKMIGEETARAALARIEPPVPFKRAPTALAMEQNRWLLALLRDADPTGAAIAFAGVRRPALGVATLARATASVPSALDGLFRCFFLADRPELLEAHVRACSGSRSRLIRDAARLVDELSRGRKHVGRLRDVRRARDRLRAALGRRPAA
jgi:hypothetical protein